MLPASSTFKKKPRMKLKILIILEALCGLAVACLAVPYVAEHRPKPTPKVEWATSGDAPPRMKAKVAVPVNVASVEGGSFVLPHSRVDIVCVTTNSDGGTDFETILENVLVLGSEGGLLGSNSVAVQVTPEEAERLALAQKLGRFRLIPRQLIPRQSDDEAIAQEKHAGVWAKGTLAPAVESLRKSFSVKPP